MLTPLNFPRLGFLRISYVLKGDEFCMTRTSSLILIIIGFLVILALLRFEATRDMASVYGGMTIGMGLSGLLLKDKHTIPPIHQ